MSTKKQIAIKSAIVTSATLALVFATGLQGCSPAAQSEEQMSQPKPTACEAAQSSDEFFSDVDSIGDTRNTAQNAFGNLPGNSFEDTPSESGRVTFRKRSVHVDVNALKAAFKAPLRRFILPLFPDRSVAVVIEQVFEFTSTNMLMVGKIEGDETSAVTLVVRDGIVVGDIRASATDEHYEVRFDRAGVHTISSVSPDAIDNCEAIEAATLGDVAERDLGSVSGFSPTATVAAFGTPVVDLFVAYTPKARVKQGGTTAIKALIQMGVADTNRALVDSGVNLSVRLVGMMETKVSETTNFSADLTSLRGRTDGRWDEVHAERLRLGADQVTLVGAYDGNTGVAGIGYINATAASAFTIVRTSAFGQYTFSHELGHNLGLNHSDGYLNSAGSFRTIIAYGSVKRIRRYANPNLKYNSYTTGDTNHNEAKILNANAARVAGLVASVSISPTPQPSPAASPTPISTPGPLPTASPAPVSKPTPVPNASPSPAPVPVSFPGSTPGSQAEPQPIEVTPLPATTECT